MKPDTTVNRIERALGYPTAPTQAFGVYKTPLAGVHIRTYRAAVSEPNSDNAFIHGMYMNMMYMWKVDQDYNCRLFWVRDTADFEEDNNPTISALSIQGREMLTLGPRLQRQPGVRDPSCIFRIDLDSAIKWSVFSSNGFADSSERSRYASFYSPVIRRFEPYWYFVDSWQNRYTLHRVNDSGQVLSVRSYISDTAYKKDLIEATGIFVHGNGNLTLAGILGDVTSWTIGNPPRAASQSYFARLNSSWDTVWQRCISTNETDIPATGWGLSSNIALDIVSPLSYVHRSAHRAWPGLIVLDSNGNTRINRQYKELMDFNLYGSMATKEGDVIIYGSKGPLDPVGNTPLTSKGYAFAARLSSETGDIQWLNVYDDSANIASVFTTGCITESGRIILAGQLQNKFLYCGIRDSALITSVEDQPSAEHVHALDLTVSPSPVRDLLTARLRGAESGMCSFSIYDMSGRLLLSSSAAVADSTCSVTLTTTSLPAGGYVLRCMAGRMSASQTFVIR